MAFKLVCYLALVGIASAHVAAPLILIRGYQQQQELTSPLSVVQIPKDPLPKYTYTYGVHDSISGDSKTQTETRNGDEVKGEYALNDADGYKRTVTYTANSEDGFKAVVDRKPIADVAADIQESIAAVQSISSPTIAPLVIKNLSSTEALPIVQPAQPLVYYTQGIVNSAPLVYSAPLLAQHSAVIAAPPAPVYGVPLLAHSAPIASPVIYAEPLVAHAAPIATPLTQNAPLIVQSPPIVSSSGPSATITSQSVTEPSLDLTHSSSPLVLPSTESGPYFY